jgi:hypothetical protein
VMLGRAVSRAANDFIGRGLNRDYITCPIFFFFFICPQKPRALKDSICSGEHAFSGRGG